MMTDEEKSLFKMVVMMDCLRLKKAAEEEDIRTYTHIIFEMFCATLTSMLCTTPEEKRAEFFSEAITNITKDVVAQGQKVGVELNVMFMGDSHGRN